jgi:PAS domain S-box-containing protein
LVHDVRRLLQSGAEVHGEWIRENLRNVLVLHRQDAVAVSALTGLAPGTVRGFMNGRPSSINNVLLMAEAAGYTLAELDRSPEEFRRHMHARRDGEHGDAIGASLLAFDASPTPMAIILLDGTIVKVNRELRELIGYEEGELIGAPSSSFSPGSETDRAGRRDELAATDAVRGRLAQLRRKDGSVVNAVISALVVRDEDGQPRYVIARAARAEDDDGVVPAPTDEEAS